MNKYIFTIIKQFKLKNAQNGSINLLCELVSDRSDVVELLNYKLV